MFRISTREEEDGRLALFVEGRLAGPWVSELEKCWHSELAKGAGRSKPLRVSLSGVTFIDGAGKELLARMFRSGAALEGKGCMTRAILSEIPGWREEPAGETAAPPHGKHDHELGKQR